MASAHSQDPAQLLKQNLRRTALPGLNVHAGVGALTLRPPGMPAGNSAGGRRGGEGGGREPLVVLQGRQLLIGARRHRLGCGAAWLEASPQVANQGLDGGKHTGTQTAGITVFKSGQDGACSIPGGICCLCSPKSACCQPPAAANSTGLRCAAAAAAATAGGRAARRCNAGNPSQPGIYTLRLLLDKRTQRAITL
jgi:hypothetical protein